MCDAPLDEICCSEAAITTMVMFCGYLVCVCVTRAGANYMDNVSVMVMLCLSVVLSVEVLPLYYIIDLLVFFFLSICLEVVLLSSHVSSITEGT